MARRMSLLLAGCPCGSWGNFREFAGCGPTSVDSAVLDAQSLRIQVMQRAAAATISVFGTDSGGEAVSHHQPRRFAATITVCLQRAVTTCGAVWRMGVWWMR